MVLSPFQEQFFSTGASSGLSSVFAPSFGGTGFTSSPFIDPALQTGAQSQSSGTGLLSAGKAGKGLANAVGAAGSGTFAGGFGTINQIGANFFGTGVPGLSGSLTATGATSILGAAGIGAFGGGLVSSLVGGDPTVGSALGAIGGGLGSAAAGTATGAAIGGALGIGAQALNFVLPGVGILIGGLASGLFGKKKKHPTSEFTSTISDTGLLKDIGIGTKHLDKSTAETVSSTVSNYLERIKTTFNLDIEGQKVRGGFGGGSGFLNAVRSGTKGLDPYRVTTDDVERFEFDINDPKEFDRALTELGVHLATTSGADQDTIDTIANLDIGGVRQSELFSEGNRGLGRVPLVLGGGFRGKFQGSGGNRGSFAQAANNFGLAQQTV